MYRYMREVSAVFNSTARNTALPSLSFPGVAVLFGALLVLSFLSVRVSGLFIVSAAVSGALLAVLLLFHRSPLTFIAPILSALLIALTAPSTAAAVLSLSFLPIGFSVAFAVRIGKNRMSAIAITSLATGSVSAVSAAALLAAQRISLDSFLESAREESIRFLTSHTVVTADAGEMPFFTEESAAALVSYITLLCPAIIGCTLFLLSYAATGIVRRMLTHMEADTLIPNDGWRMIPTRGMTVLYIGAQFAAFLFAAVPNAQALYYACYNLSMIFLLPLSILGFSTLLLQFRSAEALSVSSRLALIFLALMIAVAGLYWFLTFAAFYGIYIVFRHENAAP